VRRDQNKESSVGAVKIDTGDADAWSIMGKSQLQTLRTLSALLSQTSGIIDGFRLARKPKTSQNLDTIRDHRFNCNPKLSEL